MEVIAGILSLIMIVAFFSMHANLRKLLNTQNDSYTLLKEQNNLLSEQLTILKGNYNPEQL